MSKQLVKLRSSNDGVGRRLGQVALIAALTAALMIGASTGAGAAPVDSKNQVSDLIQRVAPSHGSVSLGKSTDGGHVFKAGNTATNISNEPSTPVEVAGAGASPMTVSLPSGLNLDKGLAASNGTIVYKSTNDSVDAAVQALNDGSVRIQTVIHNSSASHKFSYSIGGGFHPAVASDGKIYAVGTDAAGQYQAFAVQSAWARDANGASVPTHYEVHGDQLVQIVSPDANAAYPIVADPTWEWYNFAYGAGFNKQETRELASAGAVSGFCAALGPVGIACGVAAADWFYQAQQMANKNSCVFIAAAPLPIAVEYFSSHCV